MMPSQQHDHAREEPHRLLRDLVRLYRLLAAEPLDQPFKLLHKQPVPRFPNGAHRSR